MEPLKTSFYYPTDVSTFKKQYSQIVGGITNNKNVKTKELHDFCNKSLKYMVKTFLKDLENDHTNIQFYYNRLVLEAMLNTTTGKAQIDALILPFSPKDSEGIGKIFSHIIEQVIKDTITGVKHPDDQIRSIQTKLQKTITTLDEAIAEIKAADAKMTTAIEKQVNSQVSSLEGVKATVQDFNNIINPITKQYELSVKETLQKNGRKLRTLDFPLVSLVTTMGGKISQIKFGSKMKKKITVTEKEGMVKVKGHLKSSPIIEVDKNTTEMSEIIIDALNQLKFEYSAFSGYLINIIGILYETAPKKVIDVMDKSVAYTLNQLNNKVKLTGLEHSLAGDASTFNRYTKDGVTLFNLSIEDEGNIATQPFEVASSFKLYKPDKKSLNIQLGGQISGDTTQNVAKQILSEIERDYQDAEGLTGQAQLVNKAMSILTVQRNVINHIKGNSAVQLDDLTHNKLKGSNIVAMWSMQNAKLLMGTDINALTLGLKTDTGSIKTTNIIDVISLLSDIITRTVIKDDQIKSPISVDITGGWNPNSGINGILGGWGKHRNYYEVHGIPLGEELANPTKNYERVNEWAHKQVKITAHLNRQIMETRTKTSPDLQPLRKAYNDYIKIRQELSKVLSKIMETHHMGTDADKSMLQSLNTLKTSFEQSYQKLYTELNLFANKKG